MSRTRNYRTLAMMAACCALALATAGTALAQNGPNYRSIYGDFNPLTGRPNSAPQPKPGSDTPSSTAPLPVTRTIQTVVHDRGSQALPLSLAGAALLIALAGMGYTMLRISGLPGPVRSR